MTWAIPKKDRERNTMFEQLSHLRMIVLYEALIHAMRTNSGIGFYNNDQDHAAYRMGASGSIDSQTWGDSPEENELFQMVLALSNELGEAAKPQVSCWEHFCKLAVESYRRSSAT
jgi:hypothetical protein